MEEMQAAGLEQRVRRLEAETSRAGRWRVAVVALAALLALTAPLAVLGAGQAFGDVPPSDPFYTVIERAAGAGIAGGCGGGNYCPDDPVTREQMAAFLSRGLGRLERVAVNMSVGAGGTPTTSLSIRAGDIPGGTMQVLLIGEVQMSLPATTGCPCVIDYGLYQGDTLIPGSSRYLAIDAPTASNLTTDTFAVTATVSIPTGVTTTFKLKGSYLAGTQPMAATLKGSFSALVVPFTGNGNVSGG